MGNTLYFGKKKSPLLEPSFSGGWWEKSADGIGITLRSMIYAMPQPITIDNINGCKTDYR
jgi:hypothetical protein